MFGTGIKQKTFFCTNMLHLCHLWTYEKMKYILMPKLVTWHNFSVTTNLYNFLKTVRVHTAYTLRT